MILASSNALGSTGSLGCFLLRMIREGKRGILARGRLVDAGRNTGSDEVAT